MHLDAWTLALQTVNVVVLVWLLGRFLFRPVTAMIARRRAEADGMLADAAAAVARAQAQEAEIAQRRAALGAEAERILADAHDRADKEKTKLLHEAVAAGAEQVQAAQAAIARERASAEDDLVGRTGALAIDIARKLLGRLQPQVVTAALLDALLADLAARPETERSQIVAAGERLEIATAESLDAAQQEACRAKLDGLLGGGAGISFRSDPALIAGIELHGPHGMIRNSWQADLERIGAELQRDRHG